MHPFRTHTCNDLRKAHVGQSVKISGWVHRKRDHGNLMFVDLRDHYGLTQCVMEIDAPGFAAVEAGLSQELAIKEAERCRGCDARQYEIKLYGEGCKECSYCAEVCGLGVFGPADSFNEKGYRPMEVKHPERCVGCQLCFYACPDFSIDVKEIA